MYVSTYTPVFDTKQTSMPVLTFTNNPTQGKIGLQSMHVRVSNRSPHLEMGAPSPRVKEWDEDSVGSQSSIEVYKLQFKTRDLAAIATAWEHAVSSAHYIIIIMSKQEKTPHREARPQSSSASRC